MAEAAADLLEGWGGQEAPMCWCAMRKAVGGFILAELLTCRLAATGAPLPLPQGKAQRRHSAKHSCSCPLVHAPPASVIVKRMTPLKKFWLLSCMTEGELAQLVCLRRHTQIRLRQSSLSHTPIRLVPTW